jgi:hypothetical protein
VFTAVLVLTRFPEEDASVASFVFAPIPSLFQTLLLGFVQRPL